MLHNENLTWEYDNTSDCDNDEAPETDGDYGVNGLRTLTDDLSKDNIVETFFNNFYWLIRELRERLNLY
jgi:hypothetical protein